jgi:hypothetical protein
VVLLVRLSAACLVILSILSILIDLIDEESVLRFPLVQRTSTSIPSKDIKNTGDQQGRHRTLFTQQEDTAVDGDYFANNGYARALDISHYAMGEHENGITYVTYQGPHEDPYIVAYNHMSQEWTGPVKAGTSLLGHDPDPLDPHGSDGDLKKSGLDALSTEGSYEDDKRSFLEEDADSFYYGDGVRLTSDNHGKPAMVIDDLGYIHISFGGHVSSIVGLQVE